MCLKIYEEYLDQTLCLKHERCREILSHHKPSKICKDQIMTLNINTNLSESRDILEMFGAEDWLPEIAPLYRNLVLPNNKEIRKYPSLISSSLKLKIIKDTSNNNNNNNNGNSNNNGNKKTLLVSGKIPELSISMLPKQKASPKYITNKDVENLNQNQLYKLYNKFPQTVPKSHPVIKITNIDSDDKILVPKKIKLNY